MHGRVMVQSRSGSWVVSSQGMFPLSVCWMPECSYYSSVMDQVNQSETSIILCQPITCQDVKLGREVIKFAQVKQSLSAQLEDELDLKVGQIVKITHIIDKDWFR